MMTSENNFVDPLLAAPLLSNHGLLLTDKSTIPSSIADILSKLPGADFKIIGGPVSLSNDVENVLSNKYGYKNIERVYSSNRFTTSVKVAERVKSDYVIISSSLYFNDALAASIIAQKIKAPILYVSKDQVDNSVKNYIKANNFKKAIFIGGDLSISQKTSSEIEGLINNNTKPSNPDSNTGNIDENTELKRFLDSNLSVKRITGATRYDTAVNVSKFENNTSEKIVMVNSKSFPEALAASNLIVGKYPVLYVESSLTNNTINEIKRLNPKEIYILGNETIIPKSVEYEIDNIGYFKITRFPSSNAYDLCKNTFDYSEKKNFILASGENFVDSLLAAPLLNDYGLLTTEKNILSKSAESSISKLSNPTAKIIGGPVPVSNATQSYLESNLKLNNIDRTYGTNRFTTSVKVAEKIKSDYVIISSSLSFNDALAASTLAQKTKAPILYVSRYNIDNSVINYFKSRNIKKAIIIGGNVSVSENTEKNIERLIKKQDVVNNKAPITLSKYAVSKTSVNIFSDSSLSTKTSSMPTKKIVEVLAQTDYEAKIKYNKTIGWVNKDYFYNYDRVKFGKVVTNVPYVSQLHPVYAPNGCEPTSMLMALKGKGYTNIDLRTYLNRMPKTSSNPRYGFVGSPYGNESYRFLTIDPEPLAKYGNVYAKGNVENIQGASIDKIIIEIQNGNPVVAYETLFWNRPYFRTLPIDGIPTTRIFNNHVVLLTGYDPVNKSFYVADPYNHEKAGASRLMPFYYWKSQTVVDRCYNYDSRRFAVVIR